jgi:hypothetical protein
MQDAAGPQGLGAGSYEAAATRRLRLGGILDTRRAEVGTQSAPSRRRTAIGVRAMILRSSASDRRLA